MPVPTASQATLRAKALSLGWVIEERYQYSAAGAITAVLFVARKGGKADQTTIWQTTVALAVTELDPKVVP